MSPKGPSVMPRVPPTPEEQVADLQAEIARIDAELGRTPRNSEQRRPLLELKAKQLSSLQEMKRAARRQQGQAPRAEFARALTYLRTLCAVASAFELTADDDELLTEIREFIHRHKDVAL